MAKAARLILVVGARAVFGLFDFVSTLATCQLPNGEEPKQGNEKGCGFADSLTYHAGEYLTEWIDQRHDFVTAAATVVIALFTIALWRATDRLWDAGERQLDHLTESSERQLRAYVFPVEAVLTKLDAGHEVECKIVIKNSGQTPAYRLSHAATIGLVNFPTKGPFPECVASQATSRTNLGPGATIDKFGQKDPPLSEAELSEIKAGRRNLSFWAYRFHRRIRSQSVGQV